MDINKIYNENCLDTMARMNDDFIDLTVTSPPYDNLRTYNGYSFDFDIDLSYGSLRDTEGFEFSKKNVKSSSKYYSGHYGSANSGNTININSDYGSVTFKKN